jgi:hypothetical protein
MRARKMTRLLVAPCQYCGWVPPESATELTMLQHMQSRHDPTRMTDQQIRDGMANAALERERLRLPATEEITS